MPDCRLTKRANTDFTARYHVADPIFFHKNCKVSLRQIGVWVWDTKQVMELVDKGAPLKLISFVPNDNNKPFVGFLDMSTVPDIKARISLSILKKCIILIFKSV